VKPTTTSDFDKKAEFYIKKKLDAEIAFDNARSEKVKQRAIIEDNTDKKIAERLGTTRHVIERIRHNMEGRA
jgi:FixJ family two-component response regulator